MWCLMCRGVVGSNPKYFRMLRKIWQGKADAVQPEWKEGQWLSSPPVLVFWGCLSLCWGEQSKQGGPGVPFPVPYNGAALFSCWATHTTSLYPGSKGCSTGCRVISNAGGSAIPSGACRQVLWAGRAGRWPEGLSGDPEPLPISQCLSSNV